MREADVKGNGSGVGGKGPSRCHKATGDTAGVVVNGGRKTILIKNQLDKIKSTLKGNE